MEFIRSHKRLLAIFGLIVVLLLGTLLLLKHVDNSAFVLFAELYRNNCIAHIFYLVILKLISTIHYT